jgi:hypothetical protein
VGLPPERRTAPRLHREAVQTLLETIQERATTVTIRPEPPAGQARRGRAVKVWGATAAVPGGLGLILAGATPVIALIAAIFAAYIVTVILSAKFPGVVELVAVLRGAPRPVGWAPRDRPRAEEIGLLDGGGCEVVGSPFTQQD